jgi:uncharacterized membrane protein
MMMDDKNRGRNLDLDCFRGLIIVLMVLDHVRSMFWPTPDPTGVMATDTLLFVTRWVTHICAPGFFILSGMGLRLKKEKGGSLDKLRGSLLARGFFLMALEILFISRLWSQTPGPVVLQVIWAFGISMIFMALFLKRSSKFNLIVGLILSLTGMPFVSNLFSNKLWHVFFGTPYFEQSILGFEVYFLYAVGPWFGLMLLGYALPAYPWATKRIASVGLVLLGLFFVQGFMAAPADWMDVMRVSKYPPEPRFMWGTLGISAFILLCIRRFPISWLATLGREPLTVYTVHLLLIFIAGRLIDLDKVYWIFGIWVVVVAVLIPVAWGVTQLKFLRRLKRQGK